MDTGGYCYTRFSVKTCIMGVSGVGKTSIALKLSSRFSMAHVRPTIGAALILKTMHIYPFEVQLQLWDTAGQETYNSVLPLFYRKSGAAIVVYDITDEKSFQALPNLINELKRFADDDCLVCILGNKTDKEEERVVDKEQANEFARSVGALHYEVSAYTNEGITDAFLMVARLLLNKRRLFSDISTPPTIVNYSRRESTIALTNNEERKKCC